MVAEGQSFYGMFGEKTPGQLALEYGYFGVAVVLDLTKGIPPEETNETIRHQISVLEKAVKIAAGIFVEGVDRAH